jgi:hypothetical protein
VRSIRPTAPAWCRSLTRYKNPVPYQARGSPAISTYFGQFALSPCTASQRPLPMPRTVPAFVGALGAETDDVIAWSETRAVVAVPGAG